MSSGVVPVSVLPLKGKIGPGSPDCKAALILKEKVGRPLNVSRLRSFVVCGKVALSRRSRLLRCPIVARSPPSSISFGDKAVGDDELDAPLETICADAGDSPSSHPNGLARLREEPMAPFAGAGALPFERGEMVVAFSSGRASAAEATRRVNAMKHFLATKLLQRTTRRSLNQPTAPW